MITVGGKVINSEHVTLVTHPSNGAYVMIYFVNGKHAEISTDSLKQFTYNDETTPLQAMTRLLEGDKEYWLSRLAYAVRGLD